MRKARKFKEREPICVSVREALQLVPIGRSSLYEAMKDGRIKSSKVLGIRAIDYSSLKAFMAGESDANRFVTYAQRKRERGDAQTVGKVVTAPDAGTKAATP